MKNISKAGIIFFLLTSFWGGWNIPQDKAIIAFMVVFFIAFLLPVGICKVLPHNKDKASFDIFKDLFLEVWPFVVFTVFGYLVNAYIF